MDIKELHEIFLKSTGVCTDTRTIRPNTLFFALKGEHFDGNLYAQQALEQGADYAVVSEQIEPDNSKFILVEDCLKTLQDLARYHRKQFDIPIIGITGTNGKTTSKELINAALSSQYKVLATQGNFNNHIGVPLSLLQLTETHEMAIIEMGANHVGEIAELCQIAQPNYAYITNVSPAHLEGFGSLENIIKTKLALYEYVAQNNGFAFILEENEALKKGCHTNNRLCFSIKDQEQNYYSEISKQELFVQITKLKLKGKPIEISISSHLIGSYNHANIMAAICIAEHFNIDIAKIAQAISSYQPNNNRSQLKQTDRNRIILDAYNSNPTSARLSIDNFLLLEENNKTIILGDMLELGDFSQSEHQKILQVLTEATKEEPNLRVVLIGKIFCSLRKEYPSLEYYETVKEAELIKLLTLIHKEIVLLKGSRGIQLESLSRYL